MRFSDAQNEFIARFYVAHYEVMSTNKQSVEINRQKVNLLRKLTIEFNKTFLIRLAVKQVQDKLKNLKRDSKDKWRQINKGKIRCYFFFAACIRLNFDYLVEMYIIGAICHRQSGFF